MPPVLAFFLEEPTMKTLAIILIALAIGAGLCGEWCATAALAWCSCEAWTWDDDCPEALEVED